jgi:hypothetical protein
MNGIAVLVAVLLLLGAILVGGVCFCWGYDRGYAEGWRKCENDYRGG